jgi:hypothetical protein
MIIGLALGVFVGNFFIHLYIRKSSVGESLAVALLAGVICLCLTGALSLMGIL